MQTISNVLHQILPNWNEEEAAAIPVAPQAEIDLGRRLREVVKSPAWQDVLSILERRVLHAEHDLINYNGANLNELARKQYRARAMRELFQETQIEIANAIDAADNAIPSRLAIQPGTTIGTAY